MKKSVFFLSILVISEAFPQNSSLLEFNIDSDSPSISRSTSLIPFSCDSSCVLEATIPATFSPCGSRSLDDDGTEDDHGDLNALEEDAFREGVTPFVSPSIIFSANPILSLGLQTDGNTFGAPIINMYRQFDDSAIISNCRLTLLEKIMLLHAIGNGFVYLRNDQPLCIDFKNQYITWTEAKNASQFQGVRFIILSPETAKSDKNEIINFIRLHPQITPIFVISHLKIWKELTESLIGTTHVRYTEDNKIIYVNGTWNND